MSVLSTGTRCLRAALVAVVFATSSCGLLDPDDQTYDGPPVVEFAPVLPSGTYTALVAFAAGSAEDRTVEVGVNYIGDVLAQNISGTLVVGAATTAQEGTQFTLPGESFVIAAGSFSTTVPITVHGAGLANGETVRVVLELQDGPGYEASQNYRQFTIAIGKGD